MREKIVDGAAFLLLSGPEPVTGRWNFDGSFSYSSIRDETRRSHVSRRFTR